MMYDVELLFERCS